MLKTLFSCYHPPSLFTPTPNRRHCPKRRATYSALLKSLWVLTEWLLQVPALYSEAEEAWVPRRRRQTPPRAFLGILPRHRLFRAPLYSDPSRKTNNSLRSRQCFPNPRRSRVLARQPSLRSSTAYWNAVERDHSRRWRKATILKIYLAFNWGWMTFGGRQGNSAAPEEKTPNNMSRTTKRKERTE